MLLPLHHIHPFLPHLTPNRICKSTPFFHQSRSHSPRLLLLVLSPGSTNTFSAFENPSLTIPSRKSLESRAARTTPAQEKDSRRDREHRPQTKHLALCQQTHRVRVKMALEPKWLHVPLRHPACQVRGERSRLSHERVSSGSTYTEQVAANIRGS